MLKWSKDSASKPQMKGTAKMQTAIHMGFHSKAAINSVR